MVLPNVGNPQSLEMLILLSVTAMTAAYLPFDVRCLKLKTIVSQF